MNANSNRFTASKMIDKALSVADLSNTDFLSYEDKVQYLNDAWKGLYQDIINYNINVFTVEANLVGAGGVYPLPWDCYQIKSVKNPITGVEILRKADSQGVYGSYYEIVNDTIRLGPSAGPVVITYWRKPFFLSIPNKVVETNLSLNGRVIEDVCKDSVLLRETSGDKIYIYNLLTQSELEIEVEAYTATTTFKLGNNFIIKIKNSKYSVFGFDGVELMQNVDKPDFFVKSDDGLYYEGFVTNEKFVIKELNNDTTIAELEYKENSTVIKIEDDFYVVPEGSFPIGIFDDMPAYTYNKSLYLIADSSFTIIESIHIPSIGPVYNTKYGFLTFDGKLYSNVPDTELNFPNNLYYDVLSYDLAVRFLCKQNADSSGVENLCTNAWSLLLASIDQSADFQRIKNVRR